MDSNQSEQQYYLSKLASNIISPAQYPCSVIGSNKNNLHTIVPSISNNSSLNINVKYQNAADSKIAQNISYNCYNQTEDLKFLFSPNKPKKVHTKRAKAVSQCLHNDNSSDITAAPNQLTILVQEVLPAQIPDHQPLVSAQSIPGAVSPPPLPPTVTDTIADVIKEVLVKATSNDAHDDVFLSGLKSHYDSCSPPSDNHRHTVSPILPTDNDDASTMTTTSTTNKRRNMNPQKSAPKRPKLSEPLYSDHHKPYQRCQLSAPNFRKLVHEPPIISRCAVMPPLGVMIRDLVCVNCEQLEGNCVKYKRTPFALSHPRHIALTCHDRFIVQNFNANIPTNTLLASHDIIDELDCIVAPSPNNNDLDYLSVFANDHASSPSVNLPGPNLEMLYPTQRVQSPQLSLFHCPNKDYLTRDSRFQAAHKCASTPTSDTSLVDSETGEIVSSMKMREKLADDVTDETSIVHKSSSDFSELPLYSEKVYKSTSLLWKRKVRENHVHEEDDDDLVYQAKDHRVFIGEEPSDAFIVGSVSRSKHAPKRLNMVPNEKAIKKRLPMKSSPRQFRGVKYHNFHSQAALVTNNSLISESQFIQSSRQSRTVRRRANLADSRLCSLCQREGDLPDNDRLLCLDIDRWLHAKCALWCDGVPETLSGALTNVPQSSTVLCSSCGQSGATVSCQQPRCTLKCHLPCARDLLWHLHEDRTAYCPSHATKDSGLQLATTLAVNRRVYISRNESSQIMAAINSLERQHPLRVGALVVLSIGQLLPHQIYSGNFHTLSHVYPVGFKSRRIHWSSRLVNTRSVYECEILADDDDGKPLFKVTATDDDLDDETYWGRDCTATWRTALAKIASLRRAEDLVQYFPQHIKGEDLFGLTEPSILRTIESLPGLDSVRDYAFKFGKMQLFAEMPLPINASGSVRTEPFLRLSRHMMRPSQIHQSPTFVRYSLASSLRQEQSLHQRATMTAKWHQYKRLRREWRSNVVLRRSKIQGLGLYAAKDLDKGTMVIEYVGELIRNETANKRERDYQSRKQGVYMFRLDESTVIDATRAGDLARYINHCCDPNCFTEVVECEKTSHIVVVSNRRIEKNEELNYDYKFELDDAGEEKIACLCGAQNCRRWMN